MNDMDLSPVTTCHPKNDMTAQVTLPGKTPCLQVAHAEHVGGDQGKCLHRCCHLFPGL